MYNVAFCKPNIGSVEQMVLENPIVLTAAVYVVS